MANTYLIGLPGMGKQTLMYEMILNDIERRRGVVFIDPHGSAIDALLPYLPRSRMDDIILFDPSDPQHLIPWCPLDVSGDPSLIASMIESAIKDAAGYGNTSTPTMSLYIRNAIYALLESNQPLVGLPFILMSEAYRRTILQAVSDPLVTKFWEAFEGLGPKERRQEIASTFNKAFALILDKRIRHTLTLTQSAFSIGDVFKGKILLVRLPQGSLGREQVQTIGAMLLAQFHLSAMAGGKNPPTSVYIRDAQKFDGTIVADMFASLSDYGVSVTVSNQNLGQLSPDLLAAILGNSHRQYIFRISIKDDLVLNQDIRPKHSVTQLYELPPMTAREFHDLQVTDHTVMPIRSVRDDRMPALVREHMRHNFAQRASKLERAFKAFLRAA